MAQKQDIPKVRTPKMRHHKPTGQACVELFDPNTSPRPRWVIYLGKYGTPAAQESYERELGRWRQAGYRKPIEGHDAATWVELLAAYNRHAKDWYRKPDGSETSGITHVRAAIRRTAKLYGSTKVGDFGPSDFETLRQSWIDDGLTRKTIGNYCSAFRRMLRWAVAKEFAHPDQLARVKAVEPLAEGRTAAKETDPIKPVPMARVNKIKPHVPRQVWALIQLQLLTGARGGELVVMRPCDIKTTGKVWEYRVDQHKSRWKSGKAKVVYIGPKAQAVLKPFLANRRDDAYLFSPKEAIVEQRHGKGRRPGQKATPRQSSRTVGEHYTQVSYARCITRACEAVWPTPDKLKAIKDTAERDAAVKAWRKKNHWTPHRLKHNTGSLVRRHAGLEAAQLVLGHSSAKITDAIYAERDQQKIKAAIAEIG